MRQKSAARRRSPRASCIGWKRSPAKTAGRRRRRAGDKYVHYASAIDQPAEVEPIKQPEPKPPRATRPTKLSVTAIEDWLRDPYTIYARHILKLDPLDPVDMPLSAADRGSAIHESLGEFTEAYADALPADVARVLRAHRREAFCAADGAAGGARAVVAAVSAYRALVRRMGGRAARRHRRASPPRSAARSRSRSTTSASLRSSARADRIERRRDGSYAVLDYKTGAAADRQAGADGPVAAAHAGSGDPARGRLCRYRRGLVGRRTRLCQAERQQSAGRAQDAGTEDQAERHAAAAGRGRRLCTGSSSRS